MARVTFLVTPFAFVVACSAGNAGTVTVDDGGASDGGSAGSNDDGASSADSTGTSMDSGGAVDAAADVDKSATCASTFGTALTAGFGRLDGTVTAVVPPNDQMCAAPNATHLVIQVKMGGAIYRMVVDVLSNVAPPDVYFYEMDAPLAAGAWADGWHAGDALDYVTTLGVHSTSFTAMKEADLVAKITSEIELGARISVFATNGSSEPDSAHLVHRNLTNQDGAIVIGPDSAQPHYMLLRFNEQTF
jgi:hypothetical protein